MRFKLRSFVFIITVLLLFNTNSKSHAFATGDDWNLLSQTSYNVNMQPGTDSTTPMPVVVGNFIGDSNDDVAISNPNLNGGVVQIFQGDGTSFTLTKTISHSVNTHFFGTSIAKISDIDATPDSRDELIIGDNYYEAGVTNPSVFIYTSATLAAAGATLNETQATLVIEDDRTVVPDSAFGSAVASVDNFAGSSEPELIVADGIATGEVNIFDGAALKAAVGGGAPAVAGVWALNTTAPSGVISAPAAGYQSAPTSFGIAIASGGDINGDGTYSEILVTDPTEDNVNNIGQVYIYLGGATIDVTVDETITGSILNRGTSTDNTLFGKTILGGFDLDGDTYGDILVGAPDDGPSGAGIAYVYFGDSTVSQVSDVKMTLYGGGDSASNFGSALAVFDAYDDGNTTADDLYDDVIVAAPGAYETGRLYYLEGDSRANLGGEYDNVMIGSLYAASSAVVPAGESLGFSLGAGTSSLYLFSFNNTRMYHVAVTTTPATTIGGNVSDSTLPNGKLTAGTYNVRADLIVPVGQTLTIEPGTTLLFNPIKFNAEGFANEQLEFLVYGSVIANGTAANRITINMNRDAGDTTWGSWSGVMLKEFSSGSFLYTDIKYGLNGLWVDRASLTLQNSTATNNGGTHVAPSDCIVDCTIDTGNGLFVKGGTLAPLTYNIFTDNELNGVLINAPEGDSDPNNTLGEVDTCIFSNNVGSGFENADADLYIARFANNTVENNAATGATGFYFTAILNNDFNNNGSDGLAGCESVTATDNTFDGNVTGISATDSIITGNTFINNSGWGASLSGGTFTRNYVGINVSAGTWPPPSPLPTVNTDGNLDGIDVSGRADVSENHIMYNSIDGMWWDSNDSTSEAPGILWNNTIMYNGGDAIVLFDADPKIVGNEISNNGYSFFWHGINLDEISGPIISSNNLHSNSFMNIFLKAVGPSSTVEPYSISAPGNYWGGSTASPYTRDQIYLKIYDSGDDPVSIPGTVLISSYALDPIDLSTVPKPTSVVKPQESIIGCFVATASYDETDTADNAGLNNNVFNKLYKLIDDVFFSE